MFTAQGPSIDECFVLGTDPSAVPLDARGRDICPCISAYNVGTSLHMDVMTTEPSFQFYSGDSINVAQIQARDGYEEKMPRRGFELYHIAMLHASSACAVATANPIPLPDPLMMAVLLHKENRSSIEPPSTTCLSLWMKRPPLSGFKGEDMMDAIDVNSTRKRSLRGEVHLSRRVDFNRVRLPLLWTLRMCNVSVCSRVKKLAVAECGNPVTGAVDWR